MIQLAETEAPFRTGRYGGSQPAKSVAVNLAGTVLLTAPHAVAQQRNGVRKPADVGTGSLAAIAARHSGASHLIATGFQYDDGNFADHGLFKDTFRDLLRSHAAVIDIHGMRADHGVDVCLGLGPDLSLSGELQHLAAALFRARGLSVVANSPFDAVFEGTLTATAHRHGVPALEIELAPALRDVANSLAAATACAILTELATRAAL